MIYLSDLEWIAFLIILFFHNIMHWISIANANTLNIEATFELVYLALPKSVGIRVIFAIYGICYTVLLLLLLSRGQIRVYQAVEKLLKNLQAGIATYGVKLAHHVHYIEHTSHK